MVVPPNLIIFLMGLGYLCIGKPLRFVVVLCIQVFGLIPMTILGLRDWCPPLLIILWLFTLGDVCIQTRKVNRAMGTEPGVVQKGRIPDWVLNAVVLVPAGILCLLAVAPGLWPYGDQVLGLT